MNTFRPLAVVTGIVSMALCACGGSPPSPVASGPTAAPVPVAPPALADVATVSGTVMGFGSIVVDGVRIDDHSVLPGLKMTTARGLRQRKSRSDIMSVSNMQRPTLIKKCLNHRYGEPAVRLASWRLHTINPYANFVDVLQRARRDMITTAHLEEVFAIIRYGRIFMILLDDLTT